MNEAKRATRGVVSGSRGVEGVDLRLQCAVDCAPAPTATFAGAVRRTSLFERTVQIHVAGTAAAGAPREIWCSGPILEAVQSARLFPDSKTFVDSPLLVPPDECWQRWDALPQPVPRDALAAFVEATFGPPGHDLVEWTPPDHKQSPALLTRLPAGTVQDWAAALVAEAEAAAETEAAAAASRSASTSNGSTGC